MPISRIRMYALEAAFVAEKYCVRVGVLLMIGGLALQGYILTGSHFLYTTRVVGGAVGLFGILLIVSQPLFRKARERLESQLKSS